MDRLEARLECVRIAGEHSAGQPSGALLGLARQLIALVEAHGPATETSEPMGADFLAGDADRRSIPTDPDDAAAPPDDGVSTAKDPEGGEDDPAPAGAPRNAPAGGRDPTAGVLAAMRALAMTRPSGEIGLSKAEIAEASGRSVATVTYHLKKLIAAGRVVAEGATSSRRYLPVVEPETTNAIPREGRSGTAAGVGQGRPAETSEAPGADDGTADAPAAGAQPAAPSADPEIPLPEQRQRRRCLRCDKSFMSDGPGNRICPGCSPAVRNLAGGLDDAQQVAS